MPLLVLAPLLLSLAGGPALDSWSATAAAWAGRAAERLIPDSAARPQFDGPDRAVSNWRGEATRGLHPLPVATLAALLDADRPVVTRCVKLNNYWCIKRARWTGEVGADDEGHVGFATAEHGADAAVTLLRRYYLDFDRKSALDIVRRWAPAECRGGPSIAVPTLTVKGIGQTLRARWLAAQRSRIAKPARIAAAPVAPRAARPSLRPSRVPAVRLRPLPAFRVPDIAVGMGERRLVTASAALAPRLPKRRQPTPGSIAAASAAKTKAVAAPSQPVRLAAVGPMAPAPVPAGCGSDEGRIRNYAAKIVDGLDLGPSDDLRLFAADGTPSPILPRVMLNMSSVELGVLRASLDLIEAAILRATPRPATSAALAPAPDAPSKP